MPRLGLLAPSMSAHPRTATQSSLPGGPLNPEFRHVVNELAHQAREDDRRVKQDAEQRAKKRHFSRVVVVGLLLIAAEAGLLVLLHARSRSGPKAAITAVPIMNCNAAMHVAYWKIVDYMHAEGHPPVKLSDLVPKYADSVPFDPVSRKPLRYSTDGAKFKVGCPGPSAP